MSSIFPSQAVRLRPAVLTKLLASWQEVHFRTTRSRFGPSGILGSTCALACTLRNAKLASMKADDFTVLISGAPTPNTLSPSRSPVADITDLMAGDMPLGNPEPAFAPRP